MNEKSSISEKLAVARLVYKEVREVMKKWEDTKSYKIECGWSGAIFVDDEMFCIGLDDEGN